ncbi:uncharacterized protein LOC110725020 [Chenopodium quinoa]|uniref:uncharacterized protein LOC110725020 n=1 Tax=Chenopodium quinoa TaxID=63459 RepID=UPI000B778E7E|nr:uncharacterized protein LOC110725020 [Chenopodium quinoa]
MKMNGVTDDAIKLRLFPFSIRDRAKEWLRDEGTGSFDTWDKLVKAFLVKFLGQEKTARLRNELSTFKQSDDESLYEAWRRFKRLQRQCPHHGIPEWLLIQTFYNGLTHEFRIYIDAASGGSLMTKNPNEAKELIEKMAANDNYHPGGRDTVKTRGKFDVDALTLLTSHIAPQCQPPSDEMSIEQANAFYTTAPKRPYDAHSNTYNEGWRNHQDSSYTNTQAQLYSLPPPPSFQARASFNHQPMNQQLPPQTSKYNLDSIMETFTTSLLRQQELMTKQFELQAKQNEHFKSSIQLLIGQNKRTETHLSQLSQQVSHLSTLHDQEKVQKEQCNAVFLRRDESFSRKIDEKVSSVESRKDEKCEDVKSPKYVAPPAYEEPMPFPQRLSKAVLDKHFGKYCETLKKVYASIPYSDLLIQMPQFANFVNNIKDQHEDKEVVNEKGSTVLCDSLPPKLHNPGSFTIPCMINEKFFDKVLCDLGASVNLMPYSLNEKLGLQKLKPSPTSLQMADRTFRLPMGVVEDVLVKVGELVFLVDFVVMDMKEDHKIPIIFRRPFVATSQALIDVPRGQVTIRAQNKQKFFDKRGQIPPNDVFSYMKISSDTKHVKYKVKESLGGRYFHGQHRGVPSSCGDPAVVAQLSALPANALLVAGQLLLCCMLFVDAGSGCAVVVMLDVLLLVCLLSWLSKSVGYLLLAGCLLMLFPASAC